MNAHPNNYTEIPELDMGPYLAGEKGARKELAAKLRHIQENIGFMVAVNHGFPWELLEQTVEKLKLFFAKPAEEKLNYKINELSLGYIPPKSTVYVSSVINQNTKLDLNETLFDVDVGGTILTHGSQLHVVTIGSVVLESVEHVHRT